MSRPAMSRHLRVLRDSGLVVEDEVADDGRVRMYSLRRKPFREVRGWLDEVEAFWGEQLDAFKAEVERRAKEEVAPKPRAFAKAKR